MKSIGIIPARGGSKSVPKKNIFPLCGRPLICYTIEAAKNSGIDKVVVSTDCEEIAQVARSQNVEVIVRPEKLALDDTPTLPVLQDVIDRIDTYFDYVVTLQPTSPLRNATHIDEALTKIYEDPSADSLVSVVAVPHNMVPGSIMSIKEGILKNYISCQEPVLRRQEKEVYYARNGAAIYITKSENLNHYIFGGRTLPFEMDVFSSVDIDSLEDLEIAELYLKAKKIEPG